MIRQYILFATSFLCFIVLSDGRVRCRELVNDGGRTKNKSHGWESNPNYGTK